jgi:adenylate cyclase
VQTGLIERNAGLPPERCIEFRVGIPLGDESDGDLMGDGVNIAARLDGIASRAECVSQRTRIARLRPASICRSAILDRPN